MTFDQYVELVYLDKLYSRKEFISNLDNVLFDYFSIEKNLCEDKKIVLLNGEADYFVNKFFDNRKMTPQELFDKFSSFIPVKIRNFADLTGGEESRRFSDIEYPTIRTFAVTGRSWLVFISPINGTLTFF